MRGRALFDKVVDMCGISGVLGPGLVRRALADQGVDPAHGTPEHYEETLSRLRDRLATYVPPEEAARRIRRIAGMLAHVKGELVSDDEEDWSTFGRVVEELRAANADLDKKAEAKAAERQRLMQTGERVKEGVVLPEEGPGQDKASNGD